jgi:hypothetical protein
MLHVSESYEKCSPITHHPLPVLTGCLTVVLIPLLKIARAFLSMYVTALGGA